MGVDPIEAIGREASLAAHVMGVEKVYGTASKRKYADVIAVHGDPLRYIDILRDPLIIIQRAKRYKYRN